MDTPNDFGIPDARAYADRLKHSMEMAVLDSPYAVTTTLGGPGGADVVESEAASARARVRGVLLWFARDELPEFEVPQEIPFEDRVLMEAENDLTASIQEVSRMLGPLRQKVFELMARSIRRQGISPVAIGIIKYLFPYSSEWAHPEAHLADVGARLRGSEFRYAMLELLREEVRIWRTNRPN